MQSVGNKFVGQGENEPLTNSLIFSNSNYCVLKWRFCTNSRKENIKNTRIMSRSFKKWYVCNYEELLKKSGKLKCKEKY